MRMWNVESFLLLIFWIDLADDGADVRAVLL